MPESFETPTTAFDPMEQVTIHLDTSFLIRALMPGSEEDTKLRAWLGSGRVPSMSTVAWAEFLCGPLDAHHVAIASRIVEHRIAFTEEEASLAAELFNRVGRKRQLFRDCMIAATALRHDAAIATTNPTDFKRFGVGFPK